MADIEIRNESVLQRRIAWGAVFAGVVIALVLNLVLSLFGISMGTGAMDFVQGNPFSGLGVGAIILSILVTIIALFAGGWVAGHLSGRRFSLDGVLHGVTAWGFTSLIMAYFVAGSVGSAIDKGMNVAAETVSAAGQGATDLLQNISLGELNVEFSEVKQASEKILQQTDTAALQPKAIEAMAERAQQDIQSTLSKVAQSPGSAAEALDKLIDTLFSRADKLLSEVDQTAVANVFVARTDMSEAEAQQAAQKWMNQFENAKMDLNQLRAQTKRTVLEAADEVAQTTSQAAVWFAILLVIGGVSAGFGGYTGTSTVRLLERKDRQADEQRQIHDDTVIEERRVG